MTIWIWSSGEPCGPWASCFLSGFLLYYCSILYRLNNIICSLNDIMNRSNEIFVFLISSLVFLVSVFLINIGKQMTLPGFRRIASVLLHCFQTIFVLFFVGLTCVELKTRKTKFWRHQDDVPDTYLSTVEAIYYFMREFHETFMNTNYKGEYDNILFFFTFMYRKIRTIYDGGNELRAYKKRKVTHT